ncbi:hypothetical protein [Lyngbya sp. CCY1209]|uniref:hypothetical protein n=1 Tax=Lyngbya sp. CCY1209 TaxID=2886103 RepID=UPI002D204D7E|nr:hypothetical protein [Lyngbya sp. CCY1209]MEB3887151.1 hypothetical protein [Lyngbya sp. CCY1209]
MESNTDRNHNPKGIEPSAKARPDLTGQGRPGQQTDTSSYLWSNPGDRRNDRQFPHRRH